MLPTVKIGSLIMSQHALTSRLAFAKSEVIYIFGPTALLCAISALVLQVAARHYPEFGIPVHSAWHTVWVALEVFIFIMLSFFLLTLAFMQSPSDTESD
jgi:hypothetical protein